MIHHSKILPGKPGFFLVVIKQKIYALNAIASADISNFRNKLKITAKLHSKSLKVTLPDYSKHLLFKYTPVLRERGTLQLIYLK